MNLLIIMTLSDIKNLKVEIFKESLSPIAFALFTNADEKQPSALTIFSTMRLANSVVEKKFDDLILVLENSIPDNSKKYTSKSENLIDDNKFVTFVFNDDLNSNDLDKLLADALSGKDKSRKKQMLLLHHNLVKFLWNTQMQR